VSKLACNPCREKSSCPHLHADPASLVLLFPHRFTLPCICRGGQPRHCGETSMVWVWCLLSESSAWLIAGADGSDVLGHHPLLGGVFVASLPKIILGDSGENPFDLLVE
jgi:hypothetical protein